MTEEERYRAAWRDRNRRSLIAILLVFGGGAVILVPAFMDSQALMENLVANGGVFFVIWCSALLASVIYAARFRCPRCDHRFTANQPRYAPYYMPYCTNCGLPAGSGPGPFVDPNFQKSN
jgi:hypothetical protein